jgi:putative hydrolase of the HAD superfamily
MKGRLYMIKAIIFDFDGLLVDTESIWYEAYRDALVEHDFHLTLEHFGRVIGTSSGALNRLIQDNVAMDVDIDVINDKAHKLYNDILLTPVLREGVQTYIDSAKEADMKLAVASSSSRDWVEGYLSKLGILQEFNVIKTREDVEQVKPDPSLYLVALEELEVDAIEAIVFEDSFNGLKAACAAGIKCVIVPNPVTAHLPFEGHALHLHSMSDMKLLEVIEELEMKKSRY